MSFIISSGTAFGFHRNKPLFKPIQLTLITAHFANRDKPRKKKNLEHKQDSQDDVVMDGVRQVRQPLMHSFALLQLCGWRKTGD